MKLLLDQGLPRSAAFLLRQAGLDVAHAGELGLSEAEDEEILSKARAENRTIVTLDSDFHLLLALTQAKSPSVIRIRIEGLKADALVELLREVIRQCSSDLQKGAAVSARENRIRIRGLPIAPTAKEAE